MDQKVKVLIFLIYALDNRFPKKSTLTILLASLVFSSPHFLFLFVLTLNPSKHGCNERKEEEPCFAFRIIHVFVYVCEACCGHSSIVFARRVGKIRTKTTNSLPKLMLN
jgi:hypothetical protein